MSYIGDYPFSSTVHGRFTTVNASGVPTTLGNTPTAEFYVNAGTTAFTAGLSLTADIGRTGVNHVSCIVTSSASGFVSGANYTVVIAAGTVSGVSMIGYPIYEFSVANRSALMPTTSLTKLAVNAGNQAAIDWGNVGNQSTSVNLSATTINVVNTATSVTTCASVSGNVSANTVQMAGVTVNASAFPVGVTAGKAGGLFIAGTNAPVTITGSGDALTISSTGANGQGINISGNGTGNGILTTGGATSGDGIHSNGSGTGHGIHALSGTGATGNGFRAASQATNGNGIVAAGNGTGDGLAVNGGTTGNGLHATGGSAASAGDGILAAVLGTGVPIRGDLTSNITGNLSGSVGSVTGAVGSVTGNVGGNVVGSVGSVTGSVGSVTGNVGGNVVGSTNSVTTAVAITSNIKKNQALAKFQFLMTDSTNHAPATGLTVTVTRSIDGGAFAAGTLSVVTEISNGTYSVDFGAGDLNGNVIVLQATAVNADTTFERIVTQP